MTLVHDAADLSHRLGEAAEAVCRRYLSNGRHEGGYWLVGDARNTPGRSLFVRLRGIDGGRKAGKWTDAATGEHGDLLDIIRESCGLSEFRDVAEEARRFLALPRETVEDFAEPTRAATPRSSQPGAAQRLFASARPITRETLAARYLLARKLPLPAGMSTLRFHSRCFYRRDDNGPQETWPALIAAATDLHGVITGVHRTWLDGHTPTPMVLDRRSIGQIAGSAIRFHTGGDIIAAGEGIETMLSLAAVAPTLPLQACGSANHLAALELSPRLNRLYIVRDNDPAGDFAFETLAARGRGLAIDVVALAPSLNDFNDDLRTFGPDHVRALLRDQLTVEDASRFLR